MSRPLQPPELYVRAENGRVVFELRDNGITLTADVSPFEALAFARGVTDCASRASVQDMDSQSKGQDGA